jgi:hypothetical protein
MTIDNMYIEAMYAAYKEKGFVTECNDGHISGHYFERREDDGRKAESNSRSVESVG